MTSKIATTMASIAVGRLLLPSAAGLAPAQAQQQLRIGLLSPTTGFLSQTGQDMVHGFQLYLNEHNGMLGGAKVNLIVEDTRASPTSP